MRVKVFKIDDLERSRDNYYMNSMNEEIIQKALI